MYSTIVAVIEIEIKFYNTSKTTKIYYKLEFISK